MKTNPIAAALFFALFAGSPLFADTLTLKNGTKYEGKLIKEDGAVYVFLCNMNKSGSIKEERRISKSDVAKLETVAPDEPLFAEIANLVPTPDLLTADDYAARIRQVRGFLAKVSVGARIKDANAMLEKLNQEATVVQAGGRKIGGLMISAADYKADAYDMDARVLEAKVRTALKQNNSIAALRAFAELEATFQPSASFRSLVPDILKTIRALRAQVGTSLASFEERETKRTTELEAQSGPDAEAIRAAVAAQLAELETRYQTEKASNQVWVTPHPDHRGSLEDSQSALDSEMSRLSAPEITAKPEHDPAKAYRSAWKLIRSGAKEVEPVTKAIEDARSANLPEPYLKQLEECAKNEGFDLGSGT